MPKRGLILAITLVGPFVAFLDGTIVNVAVPDISHSFPASSLTDISWVLNAYNVVFAALLIPAGGMADRWGQKPAFVIGLTVFALSSLACGTAPDVGFLVAARSVQAVGAALLVPASLALLLGQFPVARLAVAGAAFSAVSAGAAGIAPATGGALIQLSDWRAVFIVNVPICALAALGAGWVLPAREKGDARPRPDLIGAAAFACAVALATIAVVQGNDWGWTSARVLGSAAATVVPLALVLYRSTRHPAPVLDPALFRLRSFSVTNVANLLFAIAFFGAFLSSVLFLTGVWHYSVLRAGLALSPAPVAAVVASLPAGRLTTRFGPRVVTVIGVLIFGTGVLLYGTTLGDTPAFLSGWLPAAATAGFGVGLVGPALLGAALQEVPPGRFATASATTNAVRQVGAALGVAIVVASIGSPRPQALHGAIDRSWITCAIFAMTVLPVIVAARRGPAGTSPQETPRRQEAA
jgi:EmrB/QacA subfamily drug resistance transporter